MSKPYRIEIVVSNPLQAGAVDLEKFINSIKMDEELHSVIPYTDRDGTIAYTVIIQKINFGEMG